MLTIACIHQRSSIRLGRLNARRDLLDIAGLQLSMLGPSVLSLLTKMGDSSKNYPEAIARTVRLKRLKACTAQLGLFYKPGAGGGSIVC